ncbi:MAG: polyphosphate polymerase domain-containing protein [Clostridia bacterium]|nr:polyphosphate polymerase domain-containing protein [Clostridia bacterium]
MALPLRHELKFLIGQRQYLVLRSALKGVLKLDEHAARQGGEYAIRSLYFDTVFNSAYYDKLNGVKDRDKYRMRIYNRSGKDIFLECKTKVGNYISKRSVKIPRSLADRLIAADADGLEFTSNGLLRDVFREMRTNLLHPAVIVDYDREPFVHPAEEVRITFDKNLRSGMLSTDIFNPNIPTVPVFDSELMVLEVKYNRMLPQYIADIISFSCPEAVQTAVSKYTMCRRYEGMEA